MHMTRASCAAIIVLLASTAASLSQSWPSRPISVVSVFSAGNATDTVARIVLDQVSKDIGQPFVIENRPGGGGTVGVAAVAKAEPDGYTMLLHASTFSSQVVMHKNLSYDSLNDFTPIVPFGIQPLVLVVGTSKGFRTAGDLIAAAKAAPGSLNFASAGVGATSHLAGLRFIRAAKIDVQHIPFRGPSEAFTEVMAGRIDFFFLPLAPAIGLVKEGKIVALAVSSTKRAPTLPDIPTVVEIGYPGAAYQFWAGLFAPAKTSRAIIDKLHAATMRALTLPAVNSRLSQMGVEPLTMSVEQFGEFFREDMTATVRLAKEAGIGPAN
ncbi:MAG: Bug family tripartite tricarboxylate transporter substrate binding protein [Pseudorhodoplanes sp.]|uniref:Bug family tripartite tricarboxylate transporter substrate binding protein n=1 Tax=Pseudorhodoplanes sp. TaxID=1934341 RepID=UPI003D0E4AA9